MFKTTSIALSALVLFAGVVALTPQAHAQTSSTYNGPIYTQSGAMVTGTPVEGTTYYTSTGSQILYMNGYYYYPISNQGTGVPTLTTGTPTTNGWYITISGTQVYYNNGSYYYPIALTGTVTPTVPNTGGTVITPGVPNTGLGGNATATWFVLALAALAGIGGLSYASRRIA